MKTHFWNSSMKATRAICFTAFLSVTIICAIAQSTYEPYNFSTVAGGGGFTAVEQRGTALRLSANALDLDNAGNLYLADTGNHAIRKITPDGVVTTLAGLPGTPGSSDGTGSEARFFFPDKMIRDQAGNFYVSDAGNSTLRKMTPDGVVTTLAGKAGIYESVDGPGSKARFNGPAGLAVDSAGNIYVADNGNSTIRKVSPTATDWVVTTIAGRAAQPGAANGTGSAARFNFPQGLALDAAGNLYVGDTDNFTIRKMTPAGTNWVVTTIAGRAGVYGNVDGTNDAALFSDPKAVALDNAGNILVADEENHLIRKITPVGTNWVVTTLAGKARMPGSADGSGGDARFSFPYSFALDTAGSIYVADPGNGAIRKITVAGTNVVVTTLAGFGGNFGSADEVGIAARFKAPFGMAVDKAGNRFVTDQGNHTLRMISSDGTVSTLAGLAGYGGSANGKGEAARFNSPAGVAVDAAGNLYIADSGNSTIRKAVWTGTNWTVSTLAGTANAYGSADGTGSNARFWAPNGIAVDSGGSVYVAEGIGTIRKITPGGSVSTLAGDPRFAGEFAGTTDGTGAAARFNNPYALTVDSATNVYVADTWNHTIRKVTRARVVTTLAGLGGTPGSVDGLGQDARFNRPSGIVVDNAGNLFVTDGSNNTIRKLTPVGTNWVVTTLGGMPGFYGTSDGFGNIARFANPTGIALDDAGNLYIADLYFNTIRKGSPALSIVSSGPSFGFHGTDFGFALRASTGKLVVLDASTDLKIWEPVLTNNVAMGLELTDSQSGNHPHRFYRLRTP
jgi:sugar lactone lactonase YvrE